VSAHLRGASERLRLFVDAQLIIASQATSRYTNALYGAAALDLPRRGVVHAAGGMGSIAGTLVEAVRGNGGQVYLRQEATCIIMEGGKPVAVETNKGLSVPADVVIVNLPPWNVTQLLGEHAPRRLRNLPPNPNQLWGAFMIYVGLDGAAVPDDFALHHQVVRGEPLGNGNSVFLSLSPAWDEGRAPAGRRTLTLSTHTQLASWWDLFEGDRKAYEARKNEYVARVLAAAGVALPGLGDAANLILPGTPVTFQRFTRRRWGWVGGFPQTSLFHAWGPRLAPGLWLVGDSIFPGQSVPAVALGGLRVARSILAELDLEEYRNGKD
jgi:phytoene dehydrogenase-like protein